MEVIHTLAELDERIAACDRAEAQSDEAMRAVLQSFRMEVPQHLPRDPLSSAYRDAQMALYADVTGAAYSTAAEATRFDVDAAVRNPFPFYTGSTATAGEYFMAIGYVLNVMALPPGSRVLEFGPGWGHTSLWLAQLGHKVTVVEIEPNFCALIARRAEAAGVAIEVINDAFFAIETWESAFDAVLFYDCFHHCDDHLRLLRALTRVVAPQGRVFFGAEPIVPDFPQPWGLRLDGWALWGVRKHGWMELGFRDDYFRQALAHTGWFGRKSAVAGVPRLRVWEARHRENAGQRFAGDDPRLRTQAGRREGDVIVIDGTGQGTALFGPHVDLPPGSYRARIACRGPTAGSAVMDVVHGGGAHRVAKGKVDHAPFDLAFTVTEDVQAVEVRLFGRRGFTARIASVEIVAVGLD